MRCVAVIPARGGSKGVPRKNVRPLGGTPLVARTIAAARGAALVDAVYVSTDDAEIAAAARAAGAGIVDRPPEISGDAASSESALLHALEMIEAEGDPVRALVFLQCTSPFTTSAEIDACAAAVLRDGASCAFTASPDHAFLWGVDGAGYAVGVNHDHLAPRRRRQELPPQYRETGAVYAMDATAFRAAGVRFCGPARLVPVDTPPVEIDSEADFQLVETILGLRGSRRENALIPPSLKALVMDFDGVFTDDRVLVDQDGREAVFASRSDGMGLGLLRKATDIRLLILSKEPNPVVTARGKKLAIEVRQGIDDKLPELDRWLAEHGIARAEAAYMGNDVNDLACMQAVGFPIAPADARPEAKAVARYVTSAPGGRGALREVCEALIAAVSRA
ncbi:acylneuraminate cytidylyltransferase [Chelatococcus sambhunathii]|uniref:N-acylneuraminate cytidylyltransferase n=1 Tax=Chelatococcus sambhunathii TaxID=363953 RepID=A0ABU1DEL9_9HYPH|nr:acylneuraminate cytidylyltransferase [Chelatococcus sambhunathii]MDR4306527.1 acylneuraminate cytidylyltransferase [Chelatococcus sambhunathii]